MYRIQNGGIQVLLAHPGGPFFVNKDNGAWSIPKGEPEFEEETGIKPTGPFVPLNPIKQKGGKVPLGREEQILVRIVHAWAFEGDCDTAAIKGNTFTIEWPPKSGRQMEFPEIDRAEFFDLDTARRKIKAGQEALIEELATILE